MRYLYRGGGHDSSLLSPFPFLEDLVRQHKWMWRRSSRNPKRLVGKRVTENRESVQAESFSATLEGEGARLLREWREMQEALAIAREQMPRSQPLRDEADGMGFGWGAEEHKDSLPTIHPLGTEGVRERLRGRGEV